MSEETTTEVAEKAPQEEKKREPILPQLSPELMKTTRLYELLALFDPAEAGRTWDALVEHYKGLMTRYGQHVLRVDKWADSRKLAYEIKGLKRGTYLLIWFRAEPRSVNDLDRDLRLDERVVRHMIVVHDEEPPTVGVLAEDLEPAEQVMPAEMM